MVKATRDRGGSIVRQTIRDTGPGVWVLYILLIIAGVALAILGWRAEVSGWATDHPYLIGLLDGATGFCFGVPIIGVVVTGITRRASQNAERQKVQHAVEAQLDYLPSVIDHLSPRTDKTLSERLRDLAETAKRAEQVVSAQVEEKEWSIKVLVVAVGGKKVTVKPTIHDPAAAKELRPAVENDKQWASVGFCCGRLVSDLTQLITILHPPEASHEAFPSWFDELTSALQTILVMQLPSYRRWLPAAVKNPPGNVSVELRSLPSDTALFVLPLNRLPAEKDIDDEAAQRIRNAIQKRVSDELKDELNELTHHLNALATLVDAAASCRAELSHIK
jgi:hypothetical protein